MLILDNIIFSLQKSGGISVVWLNIIKSLINHNKSFECIEYCDAKDNMCRKLLDINNLRYNYKYKLPFALERYSNPKISIKSPFIFHSSYYRTCAKKNAINVTTVHDFTYEYLGGGLAKKVHCWQKYNTIRKSDYIVCITENTKKDLLHYLPDIDPSKIRVIYNGVSDAFYPLEHKNENPLGKYVLFIGWRVNYKNFKPTVEALVDTDYKLAIVGPSLNSHEEDYLDKTIGKDRYKTFVRISDEELNELYNNAYALAYPSEYEGFGIPVLEAQRAGCPVIAYNGSSIPEIIGDKSLLLNKVCVSEIQEKLSLLENEGFRQSIIQCGFENAKKYSWDKMGEEYISLYNEIENSFHG